MDRRRLDAELRERWLDQPDPAGWDRLDPPPAGRLAELAPRHVGSRRQRGRLATSATQSPSADRPSDPEPGGLERGTDLGLAIDEDPGRHERPARPQLVPQGAGQRHEDAGDQVGEDDVERRLAAREAAGAGTDAPRRAGSGGRSPRSIRWRSGRYRRRGLRTLRASRPRSRGCPSHSRHRGLVPRRRGRRPRSFRARPGTGGSSGGARSRRPCPGRGRGPRRRAGADAAATSDG